MTHQRFDVNPLRDGPRLDRRSLSRMLAGIGLCGGLHIADEAAAKKRKKPKSCKKGTKRCGKKCVNVATDKANCGGCGKRCAATEFCQDGGCQPCDVCPACAYQSVQAAIDDPHGPSTVRLCPGVYRAEQGQPNLTVRRNVTLVGAGSGPGGTELNGRFSGTVVRVDPAITAELRRLNITNGSGGGVRNQGDLTLTECRVAGNTTTSDGGGLFNDAGATLTLDRSVVEENHANFDGGGIASRGVLRLEACRVANNEGAGIYSSQSLSAIDTTIEGNKTAAHGAGIGCYGELILTRSTVRGNHSTAGDGGGILFNGAATMTDCEIVDNIARNSGGGVRGSASGASSLTGCTIAKNHANGPATFATGGGGLFIGGPITLTHCQIMGNDSNHEGGGIWNGFNGDLLIVDSVIEQNNAEHDGGGIYNGHRLTLRDSTVQGNASEDGSGVFNHSDGEVTLVDSVVTGNTADITGGGLFNRGDVTLDDSTVSGNTAKGGANSGGGIFVDSSATVTLLGTSSVTGNSPDDCIGC